MSRDNNNDATMAVPLAQRNLQQQQQQQQGGGLSSAYSGDRGDRDDMDDDRRDGPASSAASNSSPWYMPSFLVGRVGSNSPFGSNGTTSYEDGDDCREDDGMTMDRDGGRDGGDDDYYSKEERIHEPLKRHQQQPTEEAAANNNNNSDRMDDDGDYNNESNWEQPLSKRRLVTVGSSIRHGFFTAMPALTEHQQVMVEYTAPSTFTPLLYFMGYTPFAVGWVMVMYVGHFVQCLLSTFGPTTQSYRVVAWIPPLYHSLMDTYLWNHSMITCMLLRPDWFGATAYWLAAFFVMGQQQLYLTVSLKTHYVHHKHEITGATPHQIHRTQRAIELRLIDTFLLYAAADVCFVVARLAGFQYLLWVGLVIFNTCPLYLVFAYMARMDEATSSSSSSLSGAAAAALKNNNTKKIK